MSGLLAVIPVLDPVIATPCLRSLTRRDSAAGLDPADLLVIDNTRHGFPIPNVWQGARTYRDPDGHNLGVARSWNIGARHVVEHDLDYLLVISAVMRFGPILHVTWLQQMQSVWGADVIEADGHSWHLIAFHRTVFEEIGYFDPAFYPAYVEGIDFSYRLRMVGKEGGWPRKWVNAMSAGVAAHVDMISCPWGPLGDHYRNKWGGDKGHETFTRPYGDQPIDYIVEEPIPVLAERYELGEYGTGWW